MKATIRLWTWTRWAPLLALAAILAACGAAVASDPATTKPATTPAPTDRQATCADSAIHLPDLGPRGIHGAIVSDTLHMGGATAPATCMEPANQSLLAGLPLPDGRTEQAQQAQSRYYLIVINYPGGNRLYVVSRRPDGTSCVVDTNDQCIAQVTDLPDDFNLEDLPEDVRPTIPAGRPAPPTVSPPPGVEPPPNGYTPPAVSPPPGGDGAPPPAAGTAPDAAGTPQPSNGATGVAVGGPLLSWAYAPRALSYDVYWGTTRELAADTERGTPINTSSTFVTIAETASLEHETLYYWRVDARNEAGTTPGAVWSFTTGEAPTAATSAPGDVSNPQPPDGATGVSLSPSLSWAYAPRALTYDFYMGTTRDLTADTVLEDTSLPYSLWTNTYRTTLGFAPLQHGTTYYWRLDAKNEAGTTRGPVWSFTTRKTSAPPAAPLPAGEGKPTLSISADQSVLEGTPGGLEASPVIIEVNLSSPVTVGSEYHIYFWTVDGTATGGPPDETGYRAARSGADYYAISQKSYAYSWFGDCYDLVDKSTPRICGRARAFVQLPLFADNEKEENETFYIEVRPHESLQATCGRCRAKITIIDDD